MSNSTVELYYDPFDHAIDDNPYPVWKRMRAEAHIGGGPHPSGGDVTEQDTVQVRT